MFSCHKSDPDPLYEPLEKYFNPIDLPKLSLDSVQMPSGFFMGINRIIMPDSILSEQVYQEWKRDSKTNKLVLVKTEKYEVSTPISASSDQTWHRSNSLGTKDIIEINEVICVSDEEMTNTINYYTKEAYAAVFIESDVPIAGEKSWVKKDEDILTETFSVMFVKHNVFIRLFVYQKDTDKDRLKQIIEELAKKIEDRIDSFAVNKIN